MQTDDTRTNPTEVAVTVGLARADVARLLGEPEHRAVGC